MGPQSPGHQTIGCCTGLSLENITLETKGMREKGSKETSQQWALGRNLAQTPQPGLGLGLFCLLVPTILAMAFLAVCYGVSSRGISLHTNSPSAGYFGQFSWA